jgi:hypothetical protein
LVSGLFGESSAKAQEQAAIHSMQANNANDYQNLVNNNQRTLLQQTGTGGSGITQLGSRLGSAYANAGLYNSTGVAGGLNQAAAEGQSSLADLATRQNQNQQQLLDQQRNQVAQMQYGFGSQNLANARTDTATAAGGLQSYLQKMTQATLGAAGNTMTPGGGNGTGGMWGTLPASPSYGPGYDSQGFPVSKGLPMKAGFNSAAFGF